MSRTLVLHVGFPKCGSTSLQNAMADSARLLGKNDMRFVRLRPIKAINRLAAGTDTETWSGIIGESPPGLVVLSSEYLCTLTPRGIDGLLRGLISDFDSVIVVFVLRQLEDWLRSRANQIAQRIPSRGPAPSTDPERDPAGVGLHVGEPDEWLGTWSDWVAEDPQRRRIVTLPLVDATPLPTRFLRAIGRSGVALDPEVAETWSNRSVDERALELIEEMKALSDLLESRLGLESIRDDAELFTYVKSVIGLAKAWERPAGVEASDTVTRAVSKEAEAIRRRLEKRLTEPLLTEVLAIVGTRESGKKLRKERAAAKRSSPGEA